MVTTIQLNESVKKALDEMKQSSRDTYEDVIVKMMKKVSEDKEKLRELLIEGAKEMAEDSLKIVKEWEATDAEMDKYWEW
jgi:hypothetical protein